MKYKGLEEYSSCFDLEDVKYFFERLSGFVSAGFGQKEIDSVVKNVEGLEVGEGCELEFMPIYKDQAMRMIISVYMSDYDAPDVYIYSPPELNKVIDKIWDED